MSDLGIKPFYSVSRRGASLTEQQRRLCSENLARLQRRKREPVSLLDFAENVSANTSEHPAPANFTTKEIS